MTGRFVGERVVVVGAGVAGTSAARVLSAEGASVLVTEARPAAEIPTVAGLEALGVEVRTGGHDPRHLDGATLVVVGPGRAARCRARAMGTGSRASGVG